jgi:hypothetical protein
MVPSNWRRRRALEERIAERIPVVARLQADAAHAETVLADVTGQQEEVQEAWAASHRVMVGRGVAAASSSSYARSSCSPSTCRIHLSICWRRLGRHPGTPLASR